MKTLSDIATVIMGTAPPGDTYNTTGEGLPLIAGAGDYGPQYPQTKKWTTLPSSVAETGDLIICVRATIGDLNWADQRYCLGRGVAALRVATDKAYPRFVFHFLNHKKRDLARLGTGSTFPAIRKDDIATFPIPLPPLPEQRRIADILDKADAIRRKRQEAIENCDQLLKSAFRAAHGDPTTNPHGWPRKKLGEVVNFVGGSQPPKDTFISEPREGYVRLVQIRDFKTDGYPTFIPRELSRRFFEKDDVMIARYGPPVFQILRGLSASYNVALMKAEPTKDTTKDFLFHLLQIPEIHGVVVANSTRTAGQSGVNLELLGNIIVPIPPVTRQLEISRTLQSIDAISSKSKLFYQDANSLFNSLVQRAFRGEL